MRILLSIVSLAVLAASGYAGWVFLDEIAGLYDKAEPSLRLAILTGGGSALGFIINNAIQSSRERKARFFESKREAYGAFFENFLAMFKKREGKDKIEDVSKTLERLRTDIMVWGSASTINAFNKYSQQSANDPDPGTIVAFQRTEEFLRSLRKDLGHNDSSLGRFGLTKMLLRGDEHDKLPK